MDVDDKAVANQFETAYDRPPDTASLEHLNWFTSKKGNFEIRVVKYPLPLIVSARDMCTGTGRIQVAFRYIAEVGWETPGVDLFPTDELYEFYKNQIELLWEQGTPWQP
jgi:hypothetical protein